MLTLAKTGEDSLDFSGPKAISLRTSLLFQGRKLEMPYCPECGGEMQYISMTKRYVCKSCGLSVTHQELIELRQRLRPKIESDSEERKKTRKEYLKWWLGKKK